LMPLTLLGSHSIFTLDPTSHHPIRTSPTTLTHDTLLGRTAEEWVAESNISRPGKSRRTIDGKDSATIAQQILIMVKAAIMMATNIVHAFANSCKDRQISIGVRDWLL